MTPWNKGFWLLFVVMGIFVVTGTFLQVVFLDLMIGFLVIAIGLLKLSEEFTHKDLTSRHSNINESLRYLTHMVDSSNSTLVRNNEKHENRFLHFDKKRAEIEETIEDKYDSLAKKIIQQENKLNDVTKALVEVAKRHDAFVRDAKKGLGKVEKLNERTKDISTKLRSMKPKPLKTTKAKK